MSQKKSPGLPNELLQQPDVLVVGNYGEYHDIKKETGFAILTNIIHQEWAAVAVEDHKKLKGLNTQNQRDHMSEAELTLTTPAELYTANCRDDGSYRHEEYTVAGKREGSIARKARVDLARDCGVSLLSC